VGVLCCDAGGIPDFIDVDISDVAVVIGFVES
jgi:hypothetical protein